MICNANIYHIIYMKNKREGKMEDDNPLLS